MPLDLPAFNHFHHGNKVRAQNVAIMRDCVEAGQRDGSTMPALTELIDRLEHHDSATTTR